MDKNLFRKLNEHSKELQIKQEEGAKKHNLLTIQYKKLEYLKVNMDDYLGRDKIEKEKESIIKTLNRKKVGIRLQPKRVLEIIEKIQRN